VEARDVAAALITVALVATGVILATVIMMEFDGLFGQGEQRQKLVPLL
jgi:hypothetical protein